MSWRITTLIDGDIVLDETISMLKSTAFKKILPQLKAAEYVSSKKPGMAFLIFYRLTIDGIESVWSPRHP